MGLFTSFRESMLKGKTVQLSPDEVGSIVNNAFIVVGKELRRRFPGGRRFEEETGDDLTQDVMLWLMEAFQGVKPFPDKATDFNQLCFALTDKACQRAYDRWRVRFASKTGRPTLGGGSAVTPKGEEVSAQALASAGDSKRRGAPCVEEADAKAICDEVFQVALDDLLVLQDGDPAAVTAFRMRIGKSSTADEIAEILHMSPSSVNRYLRKSEFCVKRAMQTSKAQLSEEYGDEAEVWESVLEKAGRG